jgi:hypothetical protein
MRAPIPDLELLAGASPAVIDDLDDSRMCRVLDDPPGRQIIALGREVVSLACKAGQALPLIGIDPP